MECREVDNYAELSFDGELDAGDRAELEAHLNRCPACRRRCEAKGWFQSQVRARLQQQSEITAPPLGLRARVTCQIRAEEEKTRSPIVRFIPVMVGMAIFGLLVASNNGNTTPLDPDASVDRHAAHLPPEVRAFGDVRSVRRFLDQNFNHAVDFPDVERTLPHTRLVGARLDHVANREAVLLMYDHRGTRVSMMVFPAQRALTAPPRFELRTVQGHPVIVGRHRGYNVVAWTRGTLVYSVVSDVDEHDLVRLVHAF